MRGVSYYGSCNEPELAEAMDGLCKKYGSLDKKALKDLYSVGAHVAYYKKFGSSYHLLPQLESVLKGRKDLHFKSGLLPNLQRKFFF